MVAIKSLADVSQKWADVTPGRASFYEAGVRAPRTPWSQAAAAAEANQAAGVQAAISRKAYSSGVRRAGDEKWQRKALAVGVSRFGPGAAAAKTDYEQGFSRFHSIIGGTTLAPRGPKGDPKNYQRVNTLGDALHKAAIAGGA